MTSTAGFTCPTCVHAVSTARPLSPEMAALFEHGDIHDRYRSRSEAVMATAVAAVNAGWSEKTWRHVLDHSPLSEWAETQIRKTGARHQRGGGDAERRLRTTWNKAVDFVDRRPPARDHPSVMAEIAEYIATADYNPRQWKGAAGVTNRALIAALTDIAATACTLTPSASTRQLAEACNISPATASAGLHRLVNLGWLRLEHAAEGVKAAIWRLTRPDDVPDAEPATRQILEDLPPQPVRLIDASSRSHDAFAHTIHGGLGRVASRIFDVLTDGATSGLNTAQIAALTGLHPRTITRHLISLQAAGLVSSARTGTATTWARSRTAGDHELLDDALDEAAELLGTTGITAARRERHQNQRSDFIEWQTDFAARRGWAVQRGLYRPQEPQLPLQAAA